MMSLLGWMHRDTVHTQTEWRGTPSIPDITRLFHVADKCAAHNTLALATASKKFSIDSNAQSKIVASSAVHYLF